MTSVASGGTNVETREITYGRAMSETIAQLMREDASVFLAGEDIGAYGGVFGTFKGLHEEFGGDRVIDTPISEAALVGLGVGAAVCGLRPIIDIMFMDFIAIAMDQIANQAAKIKYMYGGGATVPLTITTFAGAGLSAAAQHSQSLEAWLCHVPGLKVAMPTSPYDMKGLLVSAVRDDNPTFVVCNKLLLGEKGHVPEEIYTVEFGAANVVREGTDVTLVAIGRMVQESLIAADILSRAGVNAEVIDPRTVQPLDIETLTASTCKTNHVLVVHESVRFAGIGAEIASQLQESAFDYLDAPVSRVAAPFAPVPFSPALERAYVPDGETISRAVLAMLGKES